MKRIRVIAQHPTDIQEAIDFIEAFTGKQYKKSDFYTEYLGKLKTNDFYAYDDYLSDWLRIDQGELNTPGGDVILNEYRGYNWANKAIRWIENDDIPPVIIVSAPDEEGKWYTAVGDGRGRINLANGLDIAIPAYHLVYKNIQ